MATCAVKYCGHTAKKSNFTKDGITFHRFPRDPDLKAKWIEATQRPNWFPQKHSVICSRHFTSDCFLPLKNRRRLLSTAVPTLFIRVVMEPLPETALVHVECSPEPKASTSATGEMPTEKKLIKSEHDTATALELPTDFKTTREKRFYRHIIELKQKLSYKNQQLKRLKSSNTHLIKTVAKLKSVIKDLKRHNV